MEHLWIYAAVFATCVQSLRFMLQKQVKEAGLAPLRPTFSPGYWGYVTAGGLSHTLGTDAIVILFSHRNFALGMTFKKTEVILTVLSGDLILGDSMSVNRIALICASVLALILLG